MGGGRMRWELLERNGKRGLKLHFEDSGPGIVDMKLALTDGWTSGGGMGLGLPGSKRLVNDFDIHSEPGQGTRVSITRWK
jgi:serine/threonine-protein kinase RsbT